jgi:hypothetical protein
MKLLSVGAELFQEDGRTDGRTNMTKLVVPFRNFASAPKNATLHRVHRFMEAWVFTNGLSLAKTV